MKKKQKKKQPKIQKSKNKSEKINSGQIDYEDQQIRDIVKMQCDICSEVFFLFRDAKYHYRTQHDQNGYLCCCDKKYFKRARVLEHIQRHINPNGFRY